METPRTRVCVIGAGPSGTAALRAFASAAANGDDIPEIVCFEKQAELGGLWNMSERTGLDNAGEPMHGSMCAPRPLDGSWGVARLVAHSRTVPPRAAARLRYKHLWSNGPKEALEFADYSFVEHFGQPIPSYPPREVILDYIQGRVEKAGVRRWIRFDTAVRRVARDEASDTFHVTTAHGGVELTERFDFVVVASGHFSAPDVPSFPGADRFPGRLLHSHDFRDAREFAGKDVLIVGASYSAEDIASQCFKFGAKSITCSWRTAPMPYRWPSNFRTVPLLTRLDGKTAHFCDGSSQRVDAVVLCTGYKHHFPFMDPEIRLQTANRLWCDTLHKGVFLPHCPKVAYLGMQDQWFTFNMFDAQAWYLRDFVLGKIAMPPPATMAAECAEWRAREDALAAGDESKIRFQAAYVSMLMEATDYPKVDLEAVVQLFLDLEHNKQCGIMTYRDCAHRSLKTGALAPLHHTPWLEAFDSSIEGFVGKR
jgi:trimethylamine monooxygenase